MSTQACQRVLQQEVEWEFSEQYIFPKAKVLSTIRMSEKSEILAKLAFSVIYLFFFSRNTLLKGNRSEYIQGDFTRSC